MITLSEEQIDICKEVLKKFIYKIRIGGVFQMIFHYYSDSIEEDDGCKTYKMNTPEYYASFNYERTKRQIKKKILSNRNNHWCLEEGKIKIIENLCIYHPDEFDNYFKKYIENLWTCSLNEQTEEFKKEKRELEEKNNHLLKVALGEDKYEKYCKVVNLILSDTINYPYKSDKIKVLLEIGLDIDTIFRVLQTNKKWNSPRSYVEKYYKERQEGIKQRKITVYELNSTIKHITNQLNKNHDNNE